MAGPDLSFAAAEVERLMDDACVITRPAVDAGAALNAATGVLEPTGGEPTTVYAGACMFTEERQNERDLVQAGQAINLKRYRFKIPIDSPEIMVGDTIEITGCLRMPDRVGHRFRVARTIFKTFAVSRAVLAEEEERISDRP